MIIHNRGVKLNRHIVSAKITSMPLNLHVLGKNVENLCIYCTFLSLVRVTILKVASFDEKPLSKWLPWLHKKIINIFVMSEYEHVPLFHHM